MTGSILFRGAWIADGSGRALYRSDCLTAQGKIALVEKDIAPSAAEKTVECKGKILAPGFIDSHGHSDLSLIAAPEGFSKVSQGVTTEICGNCGLSAYPLTGANREHLQELYENYGRTLNWSDRQGHLDAASKSQITVVPLVGHNTLRAAVLGYGNNPTTPAALEEMKTLLAQAMKQGAPGLSFGLLYNPGIYADEEEITALMAVVARYGGVCTAHLRSEGNSLLESMEEMFSCARRAGLKRFHISHFKTAGPANWHKLTQAMEKIEAARNSGLEITCDRYPYVESMTSLGICLPGEWGELDNSELKRRLAVPENRIKVLELLRQSHDSAYWNRCRIVATTAPNFRNLCGKIIGKCSKDPAADVAELLCADPVNSMAAFAGMSEENMHTILSQPWCTAGSDGNALPPGGTFGRPHPRSFGALAKFLRIRLDDGADPAEAVRQLTGLPAEIFHLECGLIAPEKTADLVLFDPEEIDSKADFIDPERPASGIIVRSRYC